MAEITMLEEGSTPTTPPVNKWKIYFKSGGLYIVDDAGHETGPLGNADIATLIHAATSKATPVDADEDGIWDSVSGSLRKVTWASRRSTLKTYFDTLYQPAGTGASEWNTVSDSWTYASSTTINVPSDATVTYAIGDRIRLKQGGAYKYFVVTTVAAALLTVTGGADYSVANAGITDIAYSRYIRPLGFPMYFNWTPSWTNLTVGSATQVATFMLYGGLVRANIRLTWAANTSISGNVSVSQPITKALDSYTTVGAAALVDAGTALFMGEGVSNGTNIDLRAIKVDSTYAVWAYVTSTVPHTWTTNDIITLEMIYML
jgi:hypothetical protein